MNAELLDGLIRQYKEDGYETLYIKEIGNDLFNVIDLSLYTGVKCGCVTFQTIKTNKNEHEFVPIDKIAHFSFEIGVKSSND